MERLGFLVAGALLLGGLTGCGGAEIEVAFPLYAVDLDGVQPNSTTVYRREVVTSYKSPAPFKVIQSAYAGDGLCAAVRRFQIAGAQCTEQDGVAFVEMEEMSGVAIVRDGTLVFVDGLVTEADPHLRDRALAALHEAERASLADLGRTEIVETPHPAAG